MDPPHLIFPNACTASSPTSNGVDWDLLGKTMLNVANAIVPVTLLIIAGFLAAFVRLFRNRALPETPEDKANNTVMKQALFYLNKFLFWLGLPAIIFKSLATSDIYNLEWITLLVQFLYRFGMLALIILLILAMRLISVCRHGRKKARMNCRDIVFDVLRIVTPGAWNNTMFIAYPVITTLFNEAAGVYAVLASLANQLFALPVTVILLEFFKQSYHPDASLEDAAERGEVPSLSPPPSAPPSPKLASAISTSTSTSASTHPGTVVELSPLGIDIDTPPTPGPPLSTAAARPSDLPPDEKAEPPTATEPEHLDIVLDEGSSTPASSPPSSPPPSPSPSSSSATATVTVAAVPGGAAKPKTRRRLALLIAKRTMLNPSFIATVGGIIYALTTLPLPDMLLNFVLYLSRSALGIGVFDIGVFAKTNSLFPRGSRLALIFALVLKLVVSAPVGALFAYLCGLSGVAARSTVITVSAPTALLVFGLSKEYELGTGVIGGCVALSHLLFPLSFVLLMLVFDLAGVFPVPAT